MYIDFVEYSHYHGYPRKSGLPTISNLYYVPYLVARHLTPIYVRSNCGG